MLKKLGSIVVILAAVVSLLAYFGRSAMLGTRYKVSEKEAVNYSGKATEDDARKLGEVLKKEGYFTGTSSKDVLLKKDPKDGTIISFVIVKGWDDESLLTAFRDFGKTLADSGFGRPMTVRLVDTNLSEKKELKIP